MQKKQIKEGDIIEYQNQKFKIDKVLKKGNDTFYISGCYKFNDSHFNDSPKKSSHTLKRDKQQPGQNNLKNKEDGELQVLPE